MPLPENFPSKKLLEDEGYETVEEVQEATDDELAAIKGIAVGPTLTAIREVAPFTPSPDESGAGQTSGKSETPAGPKTSLEPTAESFQAQTSKESKDQTDPTTGQDLPEGIVKNERGTLTASSTVDQADMVHPDRIKAEHQARLRQMGERISAALDV